MKYKRNLAVRAAMTLLLALFTATGAWATNFITDVMLIGGSKSEVNNLKTTYAKQGWMVINNDLNAGTSGDYIFLLCKTANCQGLNTDDYITGFYISNAEYNIPNTLENRGVTYTLTGIDGSNKFKSSKGDLNSNTLGATIHLYYTKQKFADRRAVTGISFNKTRSGAIGVNGGTGGYDLNTGASGDYIYMHVTTTTALPVLQGSGSSDDPFLISNADEWSSFAEMVNYGTYSSSYFQLTKDISTVTTMAGTTSHPFTGHFLGNGKAINVKIHGTADFPAPFSHVSGATIENLTVNGSVACSGSNNYGGGLVGYCDGGTTVISGCTVAANVSGSGFVGGIVGHGGHNALNISNSVFSGALGRFGNYAGGLVGWCDTMTMTITNCLFKGSFEPASGGLYHPIFCKNGDSEVTAEVNSTYYLKDCVPTASGDNIVSRTGTPVSTTCIDGKFDIPVTAADGITYYMAKPPTIITEAPEGMKKYYTRSGEGYGRVDDTYVPASQYGTIQIIYADNNEVYLKDPVCFAKSQTYVKGFLENNKIIVPLPQTILLSEKGYNLELAWVNINENATTDNFYADRTTTVATFTIDGNTIRLDNSNKNHVLGAVWDYDETWWYGAGDYESVYTEIALNDPISPPDGITPVTYYFTYYCYDGFTTNHFYSTVNVVKNGNDIYIQGLEHNFLPEAWAKGTLNGTKLTIPAGQFMGIYDDEPIFLTGDNYDITFTYDAEKETFTLNNDLYVYTDPNVFHSIYKYRIIKGAVISINMPEIINYDLVKVPEGAVIEDDWTIEGSFRTNSAVYSVCKSTQVAFDGNDIYIKGLPYYFPDAWLKGTINGNTATFASGQFVGENDYGQHFMVGSFNGSDIVDIDFSYDSQFKVFTLLTYLMENSTPNTKMSYYGYYSDLIVYKGEPKNTELVEVPEGLKTETYVWTGKIVDYFNEENQPEYTDFMYFINIGFDGNDVYVQGLCEDLPDAWVKGTLKGNTVTFATGQYLGTDWFFDLYLIGYDYRNKAICDIVCTFDTTNKTFTTDTWIAHSEFHYALRNYFILHSNNVWARLDNVAAKPANPSFETVALTAYFPCVELNIPVVDVDGNTMDIDKLYFRLFSDIERDIQPWAFSPDYYRYLSETLYEIPYTYHDNYDIYEGGSLVYLNKDELVGELNSIGVQSVYYGGDAVSTSDIVWHKIKDYAISTGIDEPQGEGVKSVRYYNAAGVPCDKPTTNGLYIVVKEMEDGTVKSEKVKY